MHTVAVATAVIVFTAAGIAAVSVIGFTLVPQWRRILHVLRGGDA